MCALKLSLAFSALHIECAAIDTLTLKDKFIVDTFGAVMLISTFQTRFIERIAG